MAKRSAKVQISQLNPEADSDDGNSDQHEEEETMMAVSKEARQISVPKSKLASQSNEGNYWRGVRGLNQDFVKAIQRALERDPLVNLSATLFPQYTKHWQSLSSSSSSAASKDEGGKMTSEVPEPKLDTAKAFALFNKPLKETATVQSEMKTAINTPIKAEVKAVEFKTEAVKTAEPFKFSEAVKSPAITMVSEVVQTKGAETTAPFSFSAQPAQPAPTFTFPSANTFNASAAPSFNFAASTAPTFTFAPSSNASVAPSFQPTPAPAAFSFPTLPALSVESPFSFATTTASTNNQDPEDEDEGGVPEGEAESFSNTRTNDELIKRGVGEEGEECRAETRGKIYAWQEGTWKDLGIALIKVNERKEEDATPKGRLLARQEGSGKLILNAPLNVFEVTSDPRQTGKREATVRLWQDGRLGQYLLRGKEVSDLTALIEAAQKYSQ